MLGVCTGQWQWVMLVFWLLVAQEVPLASTMGLGLMDLMLGGVGQCLLEAIRLLELDSYYQAMEWQPGTHLPMVFGLELEFFHGHLSYQGCLGLLGLFLQVGEVGLCPCHGQQQLLVLQLLPQQ
jgi:hypothetical protein